MADLDILNNQNPGTIIDENDNSIFTVTQYYNEITLVIGNSRKGVFNIPVMVVSPDNFKDIFGDIDPWLERRGGFFHRTVLKMLQSSPVLCLNLMPTDNILDKYNWQSFSVASNYINSKNRSNQISDFYNLQDGFFRRSKEQTIITSLASDSENNNRPLTFVNMSDKEYSILMIKSRNSGFDITLEDYYKSIKNIPYNLHPKDYASDYLVDIYFIEGDWSDYDKLSKDVKYSEYFDQSGIKKNRLNKFLQLSEINSSSTKYTKSLIPYFRDQNGRDMHLESINEDINELGVLCAYNEDWFESNSPDIICNNLILDKKPQIDFLSYNRFLTDLYLIKESILDAPGNSFGNKTFNIGSGREMNYSEGYVSGVKLKLLVLSTTTSLYVKPFDAETDAYVVFNGKKYDISNDISHYIDLISNLSAGNQLTYIIYVDDSGINFRLSKQIPSNLNPYIPYTDYKKEMVLGYYVISQDLSGSYSQQLYGVSINTFGFIDPFNTDIVFEPAQYNWLYTIRFKNILNINNQDYKQSRIYHVYYWLQQNLTEKDSVLIDINNKKQNIDWIESKISDSDRIIQIAIKDRTSDVTSPAGTNSNIAVYIKDLEFIEQNESKWKEQLQGYILNGGGVIGNDSDLYRAYVKGEVNSEDSFFKYINTETNVEFKSDIQNYIVLYDGSYVSYIGKKIIIYGTKHNDGLYTVLNEDILNGELVVYLKEDVRYEKIDSVSIFDADSPQTMYLYFEAGLLNAKIEPFTGDIEILYKKLFDKQLPESVWSRTIEAEVVISGNVIAVDYDRYSTIIKKGYYLKSTNNQYYNDIEYKRNITRILDVIRWSEDHSKLLVITDANIDFLNIDGDLQTQMYIPLDEWIDSYDLKVLKKFNKRKESFLDGTEQRQTEILNLLLGKMTNSLVQERYEWRYLVDSFGKGLVSNSKSQLANIVYKKGTALGFLNMPSQKDFINSLGTKYLDSSGRLDYSQVLNGGNRIDSGGVRYSLTDIGKSHVVYTHPYVAISEDTGTKIVPPSPYLATLYFKKHNTNNPTIKKWTAMAGVQNFLDGEVFGYEDLLSDDNINILHKFRVTGLTAYQNFIFYPYNENTAESIGSVMGYAHNREAMIEVETAIKLELRGYIWDTESPTINNDILEVVNGICNRYQRDGAISNYKNMIEATSDMVDAQIIRVVIMVELNGVIQTMVIEFNIMRTGTIQFL